MAVAAASYLALLGRNGFRKLGESVISNSHYASKKISALGGVSSPHFRGQFFKEFTVSYTKARASSVFRKLAASGVLAGYPVDRRFGLRVEAGMYCVTEVHTARDIARLVDALEEAV